MAQRPDQAQKGKVRQYTPEQVSQYQALLNKRSVELLNCLQVTLPLVNRCVADHVLTTADKESLMHPMKTDTERNSELVDLLRYKLFVLEEFMLILRDNNVLQHEAANILRKILDEVSSLR